MTEKSYFKFLSTDILKDIGRIYAIITAFQEEKSNSLFSEYFIFIKSDKKVIGLKYKSSPLKFFDLIIDLQFMEQQAILGAEGAIENYVYEKFKDDHPNIYLNQDYALKNWNWLSLIDIVKGETFRNDITDLKSKTQCESLRKFISNVWDNLELFSFSSEELFK